ncbi:MAG TPA: hypothetical protein VFG73_08320 [Rhodanobacteraceae bacterium]|nr:hypothetical protein [Rhodanobacteraceae bacterium]
MKPAQAHESAELETGRLLRLAAVSAGVLVLVLLVMWWLWWGLLRPPPRPATQHIPPPPRLQAHPRADLQRVRAAQAQRLQGYAWVDRKAGIARIPVERAAALMVEHAKRGKPHGTAP